MSVRKRVPEQGDACYLCGRRFAEDELARETKWGNLACHPTCELAAKRRTIFGLELQADGSGI